MERNFTKLPMEWVDRIFDRMSCIYKDRWTKLYGDERNASLYKTIWSSGLSGLSVNEIKKALSMCEAYPYAQVPTHIEFYHYAKGIRVPSKSGRLAKNEPVAGNPEIAKQHLAQIKTILAK